MGRGSYLGGSTIITPGKGGWGAKKASKSSKKKKNKPSPQARAIKEAKAEERRRQLYEKHLAEYALRCAIADFECKPFPKIPSQIYHYIEETNIDIHSAVRQHPEFVLDENAKKKLIQKREPQTKKEMSDYVRRCAICHFKGEPIPQPPRNLRRFLGDEEYRRFVEGVSRSDLFQEQLKKLGRQKRKAEEYRCKQDIKMSKIVVEIKPKRRTFKKD